MNNQINPAFSVNLTIDQSLVSERTYYDIFTDSGAFLMPMKLKIELFDSVPAN